MRAGILIIALINFVGQVGTVEGQSEIIGYVIADLQIQAGFGLAVNTARIRKLWLLIIVQEVITPNVRKARVKSILVIGENHTVGGIRYTKYRLGNNLDDLSSIIGVRDIL